MKASLRCLGDGIVGCNCRPSRRSRSACLRVHVAEESKPQASHHEEPEADLEHIEATIYKPYIFPTFLISPNVRVPEIAIGGFDSDIAPVSPHCRVTRNQPDLSRHARGSLKRRHVSHVRLHTAPEGREQLTTCPRSENPSESSQFISPSPRGFPSNTHRTCLFLYHVRD